MRDGEDGAEPPARATMDVQPVREVSRRRAEHRLSPAPKTLVGADAGSAPLVAGEMSLEDRESLDGELCTRGGRHAVAPSSDDHDVVRNALKSGSRCSQPEPVVPVRLKALVLVERTDSGSREATDGERREWWRTCFGKGVERVPIEVERLVLSVEGTSVKGDPPPTAMEGIHAGRSVCGLDESRQIVGGMEVVGVEKHEQLASREFHAVIPCGR